MLGTRPRISYRPLNIRYNRSKQMSSNRQEMMPDSTSDIYDKTMNMIESYFHDGLGYNPFLIRDGWQVAQLNFLPDFAPEAIHRVERHNATDEVFILVEGESVLIAAEESPNGLQFETIPMEPGVTYNIPTGMWHTIAMYASDLVIIVEKSETHLNDVEYRPLSPEERSSLQALVRECAES
jgi:hypothetical protein